MSINTKIRIGSKVHVKDNLMDELIRCGFVSNQERKLFVRTFKGKDVDVLDIWKEPESGQWFITADLCCEIPLSAVCCIEDSIT